MKMGKKGERGVSDQSLNISYSSRPLVYSKPIGSERGFEKVMRNIAGVELRERGGSKRERKRARGK